MKRTGFMKFAALLTVSAIAIAGCSNGNSDSGSAAPAAGTAAGTSSETGSAGGGKKFGITYWTESDFFKTIATSITTAAEAEGNSTVVVNAEQDSAKQIQIVEDFITQGVDAVFLNPVDRDAITPALELLNEAGIPIINFDSSVAKLEMVDAYVATDNVQAGILCGEAMIEDFPDGGKIAILNYPANSACLDRENGFLDTIEGHGFEVAATFDAEGTVEKGQDITSDILQAHPDLVAIFSINDQAGMGAYAACTISEADVAIYGVDGNPDAKKVIADEGSIYKMTAAQSPIKIGTTCYETAMELLNGGSLQSQQINVPVFRIDSSNVADYMDGWQ